MWRRLPTWFPNLRLQMLPLTDEQKATVAATGWLREVAFKCEPRTTKMEIKAFLEAVHGMNVERVNTINYQGKKKREMDAHGKPHYYRRSDWKKAYVVFKPPEGSQIEQEWQAQRAQQQQERLEQLRAAAVAHARVSALPSFPPTAAAAVSRQVAGTVVPRVEAASKQAKERAEALIAAKRARRAEQHAAADAAGGSGSSSSSSRGGGSRSRARSKSRGRKR